LALIEELIADHPAVELPIEGETLANEGSGLSYRANHYLNQLIDAGWLIEDEFRHNLRRMTLSLDSSAHALLALLRDVASSNLSTSARFSDTFRSVLDTLLDPVRPVFGLHDDKPYATLKDLIDRCSKGMLVLRRIENVLRRFTREQTETKSRRRNLELVVDELKKLTSTQYYQELQNPLLFARCAEAVARLEEVAFTSECIHRLVTECVQRGEEIDGAAAELRVREQVTELGNLIFGLKGEAAQIEHWAARFLKASLAKFRHLQAIPSRQVELARARMEVIVEALAGRKWWQDLPDELMPPCRLPEYGYVWGRSSLYQPRTQQVVSPPQPVRHPVARLDDSIIAQLAATRRKAITPERANAFIVHSIADVGGSIESHKLTLADTEALLDIVACFCYAGSPKVNFSLNRTDPPAGASRYVPAGRWLLERFTLHRIR
jgi:hypothetical protein